MPYAARVGDDHTCPVGAHGGGPLLPAGEPTVETKQKASAVAGEAAQCHGPPDAIMVGSPTVYLHNMMAGRVDDPTNHAGLVTSGCNTVIIGGPTAVLTVVGGVMTLTWGALTVHGSPDDVRFFAQMIREEAARSGTVQSLMGTITTDTANPVNVTLVRTGHPPIYVDAFGGNGNHTFNLNDFDGGEFSATGTGVTRGENLVHGLDEAHQGAVLGNGGADPSGNNWYAQSHQHAIDAENSYRGDVGDTTTLTSSDGGPGPNQATFLFNDGSKDVHNLSTGAVVRYDAAGNVIHP